MGAGRAVFWTVLCSVVQLITAQVSVYPKPLTGIRGLDLTISCVFHSASAQAASAIVLIRGDLGDDILVHDKYLGLSVVNTTFVQYFYGPLEDSDRGLRFHCTDFRGSEDTVNLILFVLPEVAFGPTVYQPFEGQDFIAVSTLFDPGDPPISSVRLSYQGSVITNGSGVTVLLTNSVLSVVFSNVLRNASGSYDISLTNSAGSYNTTFMLDARYPPSLTEVSNSSRTVISGQVLTIDCTPTPDGNPSSTVTFSLGSRELSSNGTILTISPVESRHGGTYTCTASNGVGSSTVTIEVDVVTIARVAADSLPVSCGTVCAVVTPVVLVVVVLCCVAGLVLGIVLCYNYLNKEKPDYTTKSEWLSEEEEEEEEEEV